MHRMLQIEPNYYVNAFPQYTEGCMVYKGLSELVKTPIAARDDSAGGTESPDSSHTNSCVSKHPGEN